MAKISKVENRAVEDAVDNEEDAVGQETAQLVRQATGDLTEDRLTELERKAIAYDLAITEILEGVSRLNDETMTLAARLDGEKEARLSASLDPIANMDQDELAKMLMSTVLQKYAEFEANHFDQLAVNRTLVRDGMKNVVKVFNMMIQELELQLRKG